MIPKSDTSNCRICQCIEFPLHIMAGHQSEYLMDCKWISLIPGIWINTCIIGLDSIIIKSALQLM